MKNTLVFALSLLISITAFSQTFVVKKVKGSQAIVDLTEGELEVGKTYLIGTNPSPISGIEKNTPMPVERNHLFGISGSFFSKSSESKTSTTTTSNTSSYFAGAIKYGWNKGIIEFGGLASFSGESVGGTNTSSYGAGGWIDFNFGHNQYGNNSLFGVGFEGAFAGANSALGNTTTITLFPSGYWKWFPFSGSNIGIRGDIGYYYAKSNQGSTETTDTGPKAVVALLNYF